MTECRVTKGDVQTARGILVEEMRLISGYIQHHMTGNDTELKEIVKLTADYADMMKEKFGTYKLLKNQYELQEREQGRK